MTRSEQGILDYLAGTGSRIVNGHELRDAIGSKTEASIKVFVHRLRAAGAPIESTRGCYGGYRLAQAIEARRAETHSGSVHESAVPQGGAQ